MAYLFICLCANGLNYFLAVFAVCSHRINKSSMFLGSPSQSVTCRLCLDWVDEPSIMMFDAFFASSAYSFADFCPISSILTHSLNQTLLLLIWPSRSPDLQIIDCVRERILTLPHFLDFSLVHFQSFLIVNLPLSAITSVSIWVTIRAWLWFEKRLVLILVLDIVPVLVCGQIYRLLLDINVSHLEKTLLYISRLNFYLVLNLTKSKLTVFNFEIQGFFLQLITSTSTGLQIWILPIHFFVCGACFCWTIRARSQVVYLMILCRNSLF